MTRSSAEISPGPPGDGLVVLIHGLGRSSGSMWVLARRLEAAGYRTVCLRYPSRSLSLDQAVARVLAQIRSLPACDGPLHLVGHSLGGVIAARLPELAPDLPIGRIVQLGSPNAGSGVADTLLDVPIARRVFGPVLGDLARHPGPASRARRGVAIGAIAGRLPSSAFGEVVGLQGPNDGLVEVHSAIAGVDRHLVLPLLHGLLPISAKVSRQTIRFLRQGDFEGPAP